METHHIAGRQTRPTGRGADQRPSESSAMRSTNGRRRTLQNPDGSPLLAMSRRCSGAAISLKDVDCDHSAICAEIPPLERSMPGCVKSTARNGGKVAALTDGSRNDEPDPLKLAIRVYPEPQSDEAHRKRRELRALAPSARRCSFSIRDANRYGAGVDLRRLPILRDGHLPRRRAILRRRSAARRSRNARSVREDARRCDRSARAAFRSCGCFRAESFLKNSTRPRIKAAA